MFLFSKSHPVSSKRQQMIATYTPCSKCQHGQVNPSMLQTIEASPQGKMGNIHSWYDAPAAIYLRIFLVDLSRDEEDGTRNHGQRQAKYDWLRVHVRTDQAGSIG